MAKKPSRKKRKLTEAQRQARAEYDKIRDALRDKLNRAKKYGIEGLPELPKIPENKNKKAIQKLKNQAKNLLKKATYKTPEGKILKGEEEIRRYQKQKAGKAGGEETARRKRQEGFIEKVTADNKAITIDPKTGEIVSETDLSTLEGIDTTDVDEYVTGIPEDIDQQIDIQDNTAEEPEPAEVDEDYAEELEEILSQVREYIDAIEYTEDDGVKSDEDVADRKSILHNMLDDAIDQYGEAGLGLILREAAENGDLNDLIDGAVRGSDEYSAFCFGELGRIINGGALTPSEAASLAEVANFNIGWSNQY